MFEKTTRRSDKNPPIIEAAERKSEFSVIDFDNYAEICNFQNNGSRRRGILSSELYEEIAKDPSTGFINSGDSRVPALIDVKYALTMGYDKARCEEHAKDLSPNVKILAIPIQELNEEEKNQFVELISADINCALFFSDHNSDESNALAAILDEARIGHFEKPMVDPRADKGDEQASLLLFSCRVEQRPDRGDRKRLRLSGVQAYYEKNIGPVMTKDGGAITTLAMGDRINEQQAEEFWDLYNNRFDFLGEGHPISMQDSKESFLEMLRSESTLIAATYSKDENAELKKLTCFTYFIDDVDKLYWLNSKYIEEKFGASSGKDEFFTSIFTPGIVSSGVGRAYSALSLGLFSRAADEAGQSASVLFENTNLSKKYIPWIVSRAIKGACKFSDLTPPEAVDKVTYRLWSIGGEGE
jgi:hypothetical protein